MNRNQRINYLAVPITLGIATIITIILAVCKQPWDFFLVGVMTSCLTHGLMVKQNHRAVRMVQVDPEHKVFKPKKSAILWCMLRMAVIAGIMVSLGFIASKRETQLEGLICMLTFLGGFMILKVVFILLLVTSKEKEVE